MKFRRLFYVRIVKPIIFMFPPDGVHHVTMNFLGFLGALPGVPALIALCMGRRTHPELETEWEGIRFASPVGLSAGLDKEGQAVEVMRAVGFGFSSVGSVTARPCDGNPKPWFYRLPKTQSLVVHAGLANQGVERVLARLDRLRPVAKKEYPTVLSVARTNDKAASSDAAGLEDMLISVKAALASPAVQVVELNISCPNALVGERFADPALFLKLLNGVRALNPTKPFFIKMPIELSWRQTRVLLEAARSAPFVKGIVFGNLKKDRRDVELKEPLPKSVQGGLSGTPTHQKSTELISKTYQTYGDRFTIVGVGGVLSAEDAYEKIKAGATFIALVTGLIMNGPSFPEELNKELVELLKADGYVHIFEAVGAAHSA